MVGAAAAYAVGQVSRAPLIRATRDSCNIVHRELIGSVVGSTAYAVPFALALNPGLKATFPWLATQAIGWQSYRFNSLRFCYHTRCGTTQVGSVLLIPEYNAGDAAPGSEQVASTYEDVAEDAPWKDITCILRPAAMDTATTRHFVRVGPVPSGQDVKLFDVGKFFLATLDFGGTPACGKLWAEYDVTFHTPQLPPDGIEDEVFQLVAAGGSIAAATPFGAAATVLTDGLYPWPGLYNSGNTLAFDDTLAGSQDLEIGAEYMFLAVGTGTVITAAAWSGATNMTLVNALFAGFPVAATSFAVASTYVVNAAQQSLTLSLTATTILSCRVYVARMPVATLY